MALFWAISIGLCIAVLTAPNPGMRNKRQGNRGWNSGRTYQGATWNSGPGQDYPAYQDTDQQGWNQQQSQGQDSWARQQGGQGGRGGQGGQGQADPMCQNPTGTNGINCTSFALCQDGVVMGIQTCGSERGQMKFNPDTGECDWAANVPCDAPKLHGDDRCSNIPPGFEQLSYFVPDPTYCNMFFVCAHGNYVGTRNCAMGEIFDEFALNCTRGGVESCTKPILPFENLH